MSERYLNAHRQLVLHESILSGLIKDYKIKGARLIKIRTILKDERKAPLEHVVKDETTKAIMDLFFPKDQKKCAS
jgi:hypothetical protein